MKVEHLVKILKGAHNAYVRNVYAGCHSPLNHIAYDWENPNLVNPE